MSQSREGRGQGVLERALDILLFIADAGPSDASAVARHLSIPLSTSYRLLTRLVDKGFLKRDLNGAFDVGWAAFYLANIAARSDNLPSRAQPILRRLSEEVGETALLAIRNGPQFVIIAKSEGIHELRTTFPLGAHLPLRRGALGLVFLAFGRPDRGTQGLLSQSERTTIRERGYTLSDQLTTPGVRAVGAPVFDHTGELACAISVTGPIHRFSFTRSQIDPVVKAARDLSHMLGAPQVWQGGHNERALRERSSQAPVGSEKQ